MSSRRRFLDAVIAFLALPGVVAFVVPWLLRPVPARIHLIGVPVVAIGIALLLWCVRDFYVAGRGTLAPWAPPKRLVVVGLYRVSRNPMYIAVLTILCGWATMFASRTLWIYAAIVAIAFHLRVVLFEEPWLARTHGGEWETYRARLPRWLGIASTRTGWLPAVWSRRRWIYAIYTLVAITRIPARTGFHLQRPACDSRLTVENVGLSLTKVPHVVLFGIFFLLTVMQFDEVGPKSIAWSVLATLALGLLVEIQEGATRTGNCRITDVLPDLVGALLAAALVMLFVVIRRRLGPPRGSIAE